MSTIKSNKPKIVVVCGQTGSGKTSLALNLCKKFNGEIVNADSRQVYKFMNIGTAKDIDKIVGAEHVLPNKRAQYIAPLQNTIQGIPVHLVNIVSPNERYNVGQFKKDAEGAIADIIYRGKVPFVVGGTGLYIDALVENFSFQPISNLKSQISKPQLKTKKLENLVQLLGKVDPQALKMVDLKNKRRVERALGYCLTTGKKFSDSRKKGKRKYDVLKIAPKINRETLHKKIDQRVEKMITEGLENEVKMLAKKYGWKSEAMTGIGYKEWRPLFANSKLQMTNYKQITNDKLQISNIQQVADQIKLSTRQYAKRQMTWFKRDKEINLVNSVKEAEKLVKSFISSHDPKAMGD